MLRSPNVERNYYSRIILVVARPSMQRKVGQTNTFVKCVVLENKDVSQFNGFGKLFDKSLCFMVCLAKNRKTKHGLSLFVFHCSTLSFRAKK